MLNEFPAPQFSQWNEALKKQANRQIDMSDAFMKLKQSGYTGDVPWTKFVGWERMGDDEWKTMLEQLNSMSDYYARRGKTLKNYEQFLKPRTV